MLKPYLALLLCCAFIAFPVLRVGASDLELAAFITYEAKTGEGEMILLITNRGEEEQTVLTDKVTFLSFGPLLTFGSRNYLIPIVELDFDILIFGTVGDSDYEEVLRELPTLGPVTLKKGATTTTHIRLDATFMRAMATPDNPVSISYRISERLATTYDLWQGKIELKTTAGALLIGEKIQPPAAAIPASAGAEAEAE